MARRASLCDLTGKWKPKYTHTVCVYMIGSYICDYLCIYIYLHNFEKIVYMNYLYSFTVTLSYTHTQKLTTFGCCHFFHMQFLLISFTFFCGRRCWIFACAHGLIRLRPPLGRGPSILDPIQAPTFRVGASA